VVVVGGIGVVVVVVVVKGMLLDEDGAVLVCNMVSPSSRGLSATRLTIAIEPAVAVADCDVDDLEVDVVVICSGSVMFKSAKAYSGCTTHNCCSCRRRRTGCLSLT
jgi:hypothetical protein